MILYLYSSLQPFGRSTVDSLIQLLVDSLRNGLADLMSEILVDFLNKIWVGPKKEQNFDRFDKRSLIRIHEQNST